MHPFFYRTSGDEAVQKKPSPVRRTTSNPSEPTYSLVNKSNAERETLIQVNASAIPHEALKKTESLMQEDLDKDEQFSQSEVDGHKPNTGEERSLDENTAAADANIAFFEDVDDLLDGSSDDEVGRIGLAL